jgi:hypothetical protein
MGLGEFPTPSLSEKGLVHVLFRQMMVLALFLVSGMVVCASLRPQP